MKKVENNRCAWLHLQLLFTLPRSVTGAAVEQQQQTNSSSNAFYIDTSRHWHCIVCFRAVLCCEVKGEVLNRTAIAQWVIILYRGWLRDHAVGSFTLAHWGPSAMLFDRTRIALFIFFSVAAVIVMWEMWMTWSNDVPLLGAIYRLTLAITFTLVWRQKQQQTRKVRVGYV